MKAQITQPGALPGNTQECAVGSFIGFHGQKRIEILLVLFVNDSAYSQSARQ